MVEIMNLLNSSINTCSNWFVNIFKSSGVTEIYLGFLFVFMAMRFILAPVLGSSIRSSAMGSDKARPTRKGDSDE